MNVLVLGGLGFVGSTIVEELHMSGVKATVYDMGMFNKVLSSDPDIIIADLFECKTKFLVDNIPKYDCVVWTMDIDCQKWFNDTANKIKVEKYVEKNLCYFEDILKLSKRMVLITEDPLTVTTGTPYHDFLARKHKIIDGVNHCITYMVNEVYGTSNRMRFDTVINGMFANAYLYGNILVGNINRVLPVIALVDLAKHVKNTVIDSTVPKQQITHRLCSYMLGDASYAVMVRQSIAQVGNFDSKNIGMTILDENITGKNNNKEILLKYEEIERKISTISDFVQYIMKYAKSGDIVMKDNYDNCKMLCSVEEYNTVCEFFKRL